MRTPARLAPLLEAELIDSVAFQLMSGKEADVFVVWCGEELRCAKVYKEAKNRSFKQMSQYTEGRSVRNSRQARAIKNKSKFGREEHEAEWQRTEVESLSLLASVGVRVPKTYAFLDGVLIMEMIRDAKGDPAPRLNDCEYDGPQAKKLHSTLIREVVRMLCAGVIHGDLSEFNVLHAADGPVIIDLPQAVQATANNASMMFTRDVTRLATYLGQFEPSLLKTQYPQEIWNLYKSGKLTPDSPLTGVHVGSGRKADVREVLSAIEGANEDQLEKLGLKPRTFKER
jgi:RIO kinase 1